MTVHREGNGSRQPAAALKAPGTGRAGISLKAEYYREVLEDPPDVGWFEVHPENYMIAGGPPLRYLEAIRRDFPLSLHGVGMSLGSPEPPEFDHLERLGALIDQVEPFVVSEHLSWSRDRERFLPDLLPLPMTHEALSVMSRNVNRAQDHLGRRLLIENPSTYIRFRDEEIPEQEFLAELARRTGCGILLDVNNLYVCKENHGFDPLTWLDALDPAQVGEVHLAGHAIDQVGQHAIRIDDHASDVIPDVWQLYGEAIRRCGPVPTLIERDANLPPLVELVAEAHQADACMQQMVGDCLDTGPGPTRAYAVRSQAEGPKSGDGPRDLTSIQHAFRVAMDGGGDADTVLTIANGQGPAVGHRLDIYRNNIICALVRALEGLYPALRNLMGVEFFGQIAGAYARSHPPAHGRLVDYGEGFPEFVEEQAVSADWPWFADVGRVELAWHRAYLAPEADALRIQSLAEVPPERMHDIRLAVHPSLRLLSSPWPVSRIWRLAQEDGEMDVDLADGPEWLVILRPQAEVEVRSFPEPGFRFIKALHEGESLGSAWEAASALDPAFDLQSHLAALFAGATFSTFHLKPRPG